MADELTPIATYMADEMNRNSSGADGKRLQQFNAYSAIHEIKEWQKLPLWKQFLMGNLPKQAQDTEMSFRIAALMSWGLLVRQDGEWDHKPKIAKRFNSANPTGLQHWHLYTDNILYYYDVWSNLHYGYVGNACGFSDSVLLDGAGLEQIGSNWLRGNSAQRDSSVSGLRAYDNPEDRIAITKGIQMRKSGGTRTILAADLVRVVTTLSGITKKPNDRR